MIKPQKLTFGMGNAKLGKQVAILSLPAGHSCLFAKVCQAKADRITGKLTDGKHSQFRCYATLSENLFKNVRASRWHNLKLLQAQKTVKEMAYLIERSIPDKVTYVRINASGDFFNQKYFDAWLLVAKRNPDRIFYGYTKALPFWINRIKEIHPNFRLVASVGGTHDWLIEPHNLRHSKVVFSEDEAKQMHLPIDHDDSHVWNYHGNFAVLLHSTQPGGSLAAKAWHQIKTKGRGGYKVSYFEHYGKSKKSVLVSVIKISGREIFSSRRVKNLFKHSNKTYA
jgi:hypothetical protein